MRIEPAFRIALIYALLSLVYIFVSDWLVEHLVDDISTRMVQTAKGAGFVSLSALVIYLLVRAELKKQERLRDITLRAQRLEAIGQLATVMAHDFNNILTVIIGAVETSEDALPSGHPALAHHATALSATEKAGELTRRMLVFSRQGRLPTQSIDVNESARQLAVMLNLATGENISLRYGLSDGLPPVLAEPSKFENILLNLVINSRDAMAQGGEIRLTTARERVESPISSGPWMVPPGDYVTVAVRDTGHGMSRQIMERVVEPFFTTKPVGKGTGLGLTTVLDSMQAWQGHLMITSARGQGTTVKMYLMPASGQDAKSAAEEIPAESAGSNGETILLVENEADVRASVSNQLKAMGYIVEGAASVSEAREILQSGRKVDLLLSDIMMDGSSTGVALAKLARSKDKDLKVILMSGYADPVLTSEMADFAELGWLAKPFDRSTLNRALRKLLK